jgi:glycosyltransferase involved in cell wall biosynthesis
MNGGVKVFYNCSSLEQWDKHNLYDTGIQRVVRELGRSLCALSDDIVPVIFDPHGRCFRISLDRGAERGNEVLVKHGDIIFSSGHDWDCLESFDAVCRYVDAGVRLVSILHDTMPINFPFTYSTEFSARFRKWLLGVLRHSSFCFANSECTRGDVEAYAVAAGTNCPPIEILRLGDNIPAETSALPSELAEKISSPYLLAVGTIEFRKNYNVLLNAYRILMGEMRFTPPIMYIVGGQGLLDGNILVQASSDPRLQGRVEVLSHVDDASLASLYQNALFTLYPSIYEGWGLPVAESLCHGKQCITSSGTSMMEIAPELTRFAHPLCPDQWANQIHELCSNQALLELENSKIRAEYSPVKWQDTAKKVLTALGISPLSNPNSGF